MPISALPTPPSRSDAPQDFSDRADALLGALPGFVTEANALQSDVNAKEASASSYATIATDKAAEAQASATTASTKASEAAASAAAAAAAANNAEIAFDSFDDKYLGSKASDPTTDNDGNPLLTGALYWNTSVGAVRVWNGSAWLSMAADASIVDFQQAGTGAVVRTAQDKLREFKSIADYLPVGYVSDGSVFYTAEIQKALDENPCLELPDGVFKHGRLVLKHQGQIIRGKGRGISVLYCPAGYGITNFSGADSDPVGADWVGAPTLEKLTLRGGFTHTDDFSPPANSWASATGRSKPFTTTDINAGLRLKRCYPYTLNEVNIEKFHRGVYVSAAALGRFNNFEISDCQYGMYGENGAVWGEAAWQVTTHRWSQGRFRNCWIGIGGSDYVQCQIDKKTVDFEPCNSGISVFNGGDNVWSGYFELCSEGIYRNGGDMGHDVIEDPFFAGSPGAFWGSGDSILLDSGIGPNGKVTLRHGLGKINGGGLRVLGGRLVQPEREKVGATVYLSPALTHAGGYTATDISWATVSASDDVLGLFSAGAPTRLTIPAALNGARVRLKSTLTIDGDATANDVLVEFKKNGASFAGKGRFAGTFAYGKTVSFETAPITVATGDYFTVSVAMNLSRTLSTGDQCWLALEVLE